MATPGSVNVTGVLALETSNGPEAVLNAKRVLPPTVLRLVPAVTFAHGSNDSERNWVMMAALLFPPAAELKRPGGNGLKLDADPGALMGVVDTTPGGVTEMAAWILGVLNVTVAGAELPPLPPLTMELSRLLAALVANESSTPVT